jgi:hypothetical protein
MADSLTKSILVSGKSCRVVARKTGRNRWEASGDLDGQYIKVEGAYSAEYAIRDWQHKADSLTPIVSPECRT